MAIAFRRIWLKNQTSKQKSNFYLYRRYTTTLVFDIPNSRSSRTSVNASTTLTNSYTVSVSELSDASSAQGRLNEPMGVEAPFQEASVLIYLLASLFGGNVLFICLFIYLFYICTVHSRYEDFFIKIQLMHSL